jgi:protein-S-isoprenylcysteine O-methyltransferase Ste14
MSDQRRVAVSWALVGLQGCLFLCVAAGALATGVGPRLPSSLWAGIGVVALGVAVLLWAARNLGSALTPLPLPNGAGLTAHGAYRWMRHPIYTGVMVACLGAAIGAGTVLAYAATLAVAVFFQAKTRLEERWLVGAYDGYAEYAARTGKFVPGIGRRRA